ncbi:zinc ribbon domain-containing protein [uncultured Enterococcus sp.]|uniref:zinc ribbon domain-containing protein n=1 Tax=uncultured Enterococcus sp. TaxID=167972 RepID=UPI0026004759|nr:zinc ribbon domain-containing protein [uncultured Enterococcus sp.]
MKYCVNCGSEMKAEARFCPKCGQDQTVGGEQKNPTSDMNSNMQGGQYQRSQPNMAQNETLQRTIVKSQNYFNYFLTQLKKPTTDASRAEGYFGYVTVLLFTFLQSLMIYLLADQANNYIMGMFNPYSELFSLFGTSSYSYSMGFSDFLRIFVVLLLFMAALVGVSFGMSRLLGSAKVSWNHYLNQFGNFYSLMIALLIVANFALFIDLASASFVAIVITLMYLINFISVVMVILAQYKTDVKTALAPFYNILLTFILIGIVDVLIIAVLTK